MCFARKKKTDLPCFSMVKNSKRTFPEIPVTQHIYAYIRVFSVMFFALF